MSKGIRNLVSRKKRRFKQDGYDLDLSYITDQLIAMGFPAQKFEGVYRNHIDEVCRFLEDKHKNNYRIYNLCSEKNRSYDEARFHNRVRNFPFDDHNPPRLIDIEPLCKDISEWLEEPQHVAVVHCKAGKGRTGVMICCYLLHSRSKKIAQDALDFYGDRRTFDRKGVTIPSQRRYVHYYGRLVSTNFNYNPPYVRLKEAKMNAPLSSVNSEVYLVVSSHENKKGYNSQTGDIRKGKEVIVLPVKEEVARPMSGDIKIELRRTNFVRRTEKLFSAWLNTHFIFEEGTKVTNGCDVNNTSDQNNHNAPNTNVRQRSNSFRVITKFKRSETVDESSRLPPKGLGDFGFRREGSKGGNKGASEAKDKKHGKTESQSLPTGHLISLTEESSWVQHTNTQTSHQNNHHHNHLRRRRHTQHIPTCGSARDSWDSEARAGEQEVRVVLTKNELDKATKDTHNKLLSEDFRIEMLWLVTYIKGRSITTLEGRDGSTPSTITPSGSSSDDDDDDDDDDEEEEGSDWDSAEGSEVLL